LKNTVQSKSSKFDGLMQAGAVLLL